MRQGERGMTLLEVVIAITILMLGVGFIFQGNGAIQRYRDQAQIRQQLAFFAAGQLEILLHGGTPIQGTGLPEPMSGFAVSWQENNTSNSHLHKIEVTVTYGSQQVTLNSYRVNW